MRSFDVFHESRPAMGTTFAVWLVAAGAERAAELFEIAFAEIERVEAALSTYRPTSEISRINRLAVDHPVTTDPETFGLLRRSVATSMRTGGAFDVAIGALVKLWRQSRERGVEPSDAQLQQVRNQSGSRYLELDKTRREVRFLRPGLQLDLGAVGKGFALDCVARRLRAAGVRAALVSGGQSTYVAIGHPPGEHLGWSIDLPVADNSTSRSIRLRDAGLSTSGNRGVSSGHIVDPRTGTPVTDMLPTTIRATSGEVSDGLATAAFVLGPDQGRKLARLEQAEVMFAETNR